MSSFISEFSDVELENIAQEFRRIKDNTYLDHAGTTLYSEQQIESAATVLKENLFCNPHTCKITGDLVDQVRFRILKHFNTTSDEYAVVFTANATAALKLVAESFDFGEQGEFYYCQENHTSVLGMRELVGASETYVLTKDQLLKNINQVEQTNGAVDRNGNSLVAFSAQCNFSGFKMPLDIIDHIQKYGLAEKGLRVRGNSFGAENKCENNFFCCIDTAAFVATNLLDLKKYKPDFCCVSFYKMFGFPTGVGALIVSKRGQAVLRKKYYGGGTVKIAMTLEDFHAKRDGFSERFEDGTLAFLSIVSLLEGFRTLDRLIPSTPSTPSAERISSHVFNLAKYCHDALSQLRHANDAPVVKFYNHCGYENKINQGGIVTFNLLHDDSSYVGFAEVACIAALYKIQLRTGCFCNPGACQHFLKLSNNDIRKQFEQGHICSDYNDLIDSQPTGAVRLSFGYMTRVEDVTKAIDMIRECYVTRSVERFQLIKRGQSVLPQVLQDVARSRMFPHLTNIFLYPVKSCGYFAVKEWKLTKSGLKYDRCWMIVDRNGMAITQKLHTRLCLIKPIIDLNRKVLRLSFPKMASIEVSLEATDDMKSISSKFCQSKVCSDLIEGIDCGEEVGVWLSDCLEEAGLRLLRQNERRGVDGVVDERSLVNQAQFLLINRSSVKWLADKVQTEKEPLNNTVDRFRANLVIDSPIPLEENDFLEIKIGSLILGMDGFCTRCQMICIDQQTGQKTAEPLRTIARELSGKIRFGIYLYIKDISEDSSISCAQELEIKKRTET